MQKHEDDLFYMSRPELKQVAKNRLRQSSVRSKLMLVALVPAVIMMVFTFYNYMQPGATGASVADLTRELQESSMRAELQNFLTIYFITGLSFTALDLIRNPDTEFTTGGTLLRLFNGRYFWSVLFLAIMVELASSVGMILLIVPYFFISYGMRQVNFVLYDAREHGDNRDLFHIMADSYRMMRGHKFDLFVLDLSFIGWNLLIYMTAGLANIWVMPYMQLTYAAFYEQVRLRYQAQQTQE
ncbi:DUF975 family protein [Lacticaseibacillus zhaodongensis]|uniref:DUF975 family protein n=1 Tax=Lacticaseibacillus zhaodongensis TaxID=2668065 RepID=UPI0012D345E6|nr:DUF975 family protein [Lacticaseibacillus zhaodongensis]